MRAWRTMKQTFFAFAFGALGRKARRGEGTLGPAFAENRVAKPALLEVAPTTATLSETRMVPWEKDLHGPFPSSRHWPFKGRVVWLETSFSCPVLSQGPLSCPLGSWLFLAFKLPPCCLDQYSTGVDWSPRLAGLVGRVGWPEG